MYWKPESINWERALTEFPPWCSFASGGWWWRFSICWPKYVEGEEEAATGASRTFLFSNSFPAALIPWSFVVVMAFSENSIATVLPGHAIIIQASQARPALQLNGFICLASHDDQREGVLAIDLDPVLEWEAEEYQEFRQLNAGKLPTMRGSVDGGWMRWGFSIPSERSRKLMMISYNSPHLLLSMSFFLSGSPPPLTVSPSFGSTTIYVADDGVSSQQQRLLWDP